MTTFTHSLTKRHDNWRAESVAQLEHNRELSIRTCRESIGIVTSVATVSKIEGNFRTHRFGFGKKGGDFLKTVFSQHLPRATSKAVQAQHNTAMAQVESILFQVRKHYEDEDREANAAQAAPPAVTAETPDTVAADTTAVSAASPSEVAA